MKNRNKTVTWEVFEQLKDRLNGIEICDETGFWRAFEFQAINQKYKIEFYKNLCNLYVGHCQIIFTHLSIDGCWPNNYKTNLNLGDEENIFAVIPLECYDSKSNSKTN